MKTLFKRLSAGLLALLCLLTLPVCASASLLTATEDYYVADYAGVLSSATCQTVIGANGALESLTGGQIVVVTVEEMQGFSPEEYAARIMDDWAVGDYSKNNGSILLLAVGEGRACLYPGSGIQDSLDEAARNSMMEDFWPEFQAGSYDSAVYNLFLKLVGWYENQYGVSVLNVGSQQENAGGGFRKFAVVFSIVVLALLAAGGVLALAIWVDRRRYRKYYYGMGVPMPRYKSRFFFSGGPHRARGPSGGARRR